jgi:hypothetical protein
MALLHIAHERLITGIHNDWRALLAINDRRPDYSPLGEAKRWIDRGWKVHGPEHAELTARLRGKGTRDAMGD